MSARKAKRRPKAHEQTPDEQAAATAAYERREAAYPVAENPLTERGFSESIHNIRCAFSYYSRLTLEDESASKLTDDVHYGRYLLGRVFISALEALEAQEKFEHAEWLVRLDAAQAKEAQS